MLVGVYTQPVVALIAGILILIMPRLLNYVVAIYLVLIGIMGLARQKSRIDLAFYKGGLSLRADPRRSQPCATVRAVDFILITTLLLPGINVRTKRVIYGVFLFLQAWINGRTKSRGEEMKNAVDDLCDPYDFVAAGSDQRLCDRGLHSYSPGSRYRRGANQNHSRTPSSIAFLAPRKNRCVY